MHLSTYLCIYLVGSLGHHLSAADYKKKLLLLLFDGFRHDYVNLTDTPSFHRLLTEGSSVPYVNGVYPTVTATSLHSIATGVYPEVHGIIGNKFYDPDLNTTIDVYGDHPELGPSLYNDTDCEPIWVTASKSGLKTAAYHWHGTQYKIQDVQPDHVLYWDVKLNFTEQVRQIIQWFADDGVDFVMHHVDEPDHTEHGTGPAPGSEETLKMIRSCDGFLGDLLDRLELYNLSEEVNVLVTADHGMTDVDMTDRLVSLYDHAHIKDIELIVEEWSRINILPVEGKVKKVYKKIKDMHPNVTVYYKEDIPDRLHYKHNNRVQPIVAMADEGWMIVGNASAVNRTLKGAHGYDNSLMSMKPIFMAVGPNIKQGERLQPFSQVDICPLICTLLGLTPNHHGNGSLSVAGLMLQETPGGYLQYPLIVITSLGTLLLMVTIAVLFVIIRRCGYVDPETKEPEDGNKEYLYHKLRENYETL